MMNTFL